MIPSNVSKETNTLAVPNNTRQYLHFLLPCEKTTIVSVSLNVYNGVRSVRVLSSVVCIATKMQVLFSIEDLWPRHEEDCVTSCRVGRKLSRNNHYLFS